jgi:hypothetical protein
MTIAVTTLGVAAHAADMPVKATLEQPWFSVNDTSVSFTWFPDAADPGIAHSTNRFEGDLTHFDVYRYGTNFIDLSYMQYGRNDPIRSNGLVFTSPFVPATQINNSQGSVEGDAFVRSTISGNAVFGRDYFKNWLTKDISFEYGGLFVAQNNELSPSTHQYDLGIQFALNLPGTVNFAVLAQKETNHNNFLAAPFACGTANVVCAFNGDRTFKWVPHLELGISEPLTFLAPWLPVTWNSATAVNFPKGSGISSPNFIFAGCGGFPATPAHNGCETKTEFLADNRLTFDVGKLYWNKAGIWETFVGYRYWMNKFGTDHNFIGFNSASVGGDSSLENTVYVGATYHFK